MITLVLGACGWALVAGAVTATAPAPDRVAALSVASAALATDTPRSNGWQ